jgi:hypothetical protein
MSTTQMRAKRHAGVVTSWTMPADLALLDARFPLTTERPFTFQQALDAGLTEHQVRLLTGRGFLRRVTRGVYVASQIEDSRRLRAEALALVVPRTCVVTDWSACWFWTGIDAPGSHLQEPPLSVFHRHRHTRLSNGFTEGGARSFRPSDLTHIGDVAITTPIRTAWDLGRLTHRDRAIGGMDALSRLGTFDVSELVDGVPRFKGQRGVVQLRGLAPVVDARSESPPESTLRLRWLDMPSLPRPTPQVRVLIGDDEVYRIDLAVEELGYGCEYDGVEFHQDAVRDAARRHDLRQRFGWDIDAVRKANVYGPTRDIEAVLYEGIDRARRTLGRRTYIA